MKRDINYTMLTDFYELTMGNGYFQTGLGEQICYFDVFFRSVPDGGGFAIAAGLEQVIDYIQNLHFDQEDIEYLRGKGCFAPEFLTSGSPAISGPCRKAPPSSPGSPSSPSGPPPSRPSSWRPSSC